MKRLKSLILNIIFCFGICSITQLHSQTIGPDNESGYLGDSQEFWDNTSHLVLSSASEATLLPLEVDNSTLMYFPQTIIGGEIWRELYIQNGNGACVGVATAHYALTYELNRVRELSGLPQAHKYPANFTWNLLNYGNYGQGSYLEDNLAILYRNGAPNREIVGEWPPADYTRWMHGYDNYFSSYPNRISGYSQITPMYDPEKNVLMKHWLADHNEGASTGGLIVFVTEGACTTMEDLVYPSNHVNEKVVVNWGEDCKHAMAIVGYCDDIVWDFNEDGQYTNTIDLNGDNIIDVRDWEIGAFNVVHLASNYDVAQEGFVWVMYKTIAECSEQYATVLHVEDGYEPIFEIKGKVTHEERSKHTFRVARGDHANSGPPSMLVSWKNSIFTSQGGVNPMQGIGNDPELEFSYNFYGHFNPSVEFGKIFVKVKNHISSTSDAILNYWSIIDRRWGEVFEIKYPIENTIIAPNGEILQAIPYDLIPHESDIESNLTFDSDMVSRFNPKVSNGATLTIGEEVNIDMYESELEIAATSSLVIDDGVTFTAKDGICKIIVDGDISIGSNVSFLAEEGAQLQLVLNKTNLTLSISGATFEGAAIISYIDELTITDYSSFTDGGIYGFNGNYMIEKASFDNSFCIISDGEYKNTVSISECLFFNNGLAYPIKIEDYSDFTIYGCILTNNYFGINIYNSGDGPNTSEISNCEISGCSQAGIQVYNSYVDIVDNIISNNFFGIRSFNNSNVKLAGNTQTLTQTIQDNTIYEVYATSGSFPYYFHYNGIVDEDNTQPMVYFSGPNDVLLDVRNNYWGTNFNASADLFPTAQFIYIPVWNPGEKSGEVVESMYNNAQEKIELEDYAGAKVDLLEIVNQYPQTLFAEASLKDIFAIEEFGENDFANLQLFLQSDPVIQNYEPLTKLAAFLSNNCEIKLQNWPDAISYFEGIISEPESMEDSIFAIIDLGYTYLLMENGGSKSAYTGTMTEHIPASGEEFEITRDFLLSLLPGNLMSEEMIGNINRLEDGKLLQNVPNPFSKSTQIWFYVSEQSNVVINVYDYTGKKLKSINPGLVEKGRQSVKFNATDLPAGIYFYSIEINGQVSDTKKMTIMK